MSFTDIPTTDKLTTDLGSLIKSIASRNGRAGDFRVKGPVPRDSSLGTILRLKWVSVAAKECKPECWDMHCPDPANHVRKFRVTIEGKAAAHRLDDTRVTRSGSYDDGDDD